MKTKEILLKEAKAKINEAAKEYGLNSLAYDEHPSEVMDEVWVDRFTEEVCELSVEDIGWMIDNILDYKEGRRGQSLASWLELHLEEKEL